MSMPNTNDVHQANENTGRDAKGRFAPGNPGGPGNPFGRKVAAFREALLACISHEQIQRIALKMAALAEEGDVQAAKLVFNYVIGKPQPAPEPDHMDADEWESFQQAAVMKDQAAAMCNAGDPEFHLKTVRTMRPVITQLMQQQLADIANVTPEERQRREDADAAECQRVLDLMRAARQEEEQEELAAADPSSNGKKRCGQSPSLNGDFDGQSPSLNGKKRPLAPPAGGNGRFVTA